MKAVKAVTTYRGRDPRDFDLLAFGGSGGVHAVDLARVLQVRRVIVPAAAGVFSAVGLLFANLEMNETAPFAHLAEVMRLDEAERIYGQLAGRIGRIIGGDPETIVFRRQADTRFAGQAYELTVPFTDGALDRAAVTELCARFEAAHLSRYGHAFSGEFPVEVVNLRLIGTRVPERQGEPSFRPKADGGAEGRRKAHFGPAFGAVAASVVSRARLTATPRRGPMIIEEYDSTTVVPPDCSARLDPMGNVIIDVEKSA